ncbi:MAG TPA: hypothetical protein VFQ20_06190 [Burkholderiaceae bacterium]|nr:hypothetical protein [Burkholderiaceae bacterium]
MHGAISTRDRPLIDALARGVPLVDHPFAAIGASIGLGEDEVLERLRGWLAQGALAYLGPVCAGAVAPEDAFEEGLVDAMRGGLPLVPRPFEALGAVLGVGDDAVRAALTRMIDAGRLLRIAGLPAAIDPARA